MWGETEGEGGGAKVTEKHRGRGTHLRRRQLGHLPPAGLGDSRERAQLPAPALPQSLWAAAPTRVRRLSLHLPAPAGSRPAGRARALPP